MQTKNVNVAPPQISACPKNEKNAMSGGQTNGTGGLVLISNGTVNMPDSSILRQPVQSVFQDENGPSGPPDLDRIDTGPGGFISSSFLPPPPLPPRMGGKPHGIHSYHLSVSAGNLYSAYKPVPPPKPFGPAEGEPECQTIGIGTTDKISRPTVTFSEAQHFIGSPVVQLSKSQSSSALPHILVTDQGHFHTHSSKFPIEPKQERVNHSTAAMVEKKAPEGLNGSSSQNGNLAERSESRLNLGFAPKGSNFKVDMSSGGTLPRSVPSGGSRVPLNAQLAFLSPSLQKKTERMPSKEELNKLLSQERSYPYGLDNPTLLDDSQMPSFRNGIAIPRDGTLAGALPSSPKMQHQRPYESPYLSRAPYMGPNHASPQTPMYHQHASNGVQMPFSRENWIRNSHGQFTNLNEVSPHAHMNGSIPVYSAQIPNGKVSYGVQQDGYHIAPVSYSKSVCAQMNGYCHQYNDSCNSLPVSNNSQLENVGETNNKHLSKCDEDSKANDVNEMQEDARKDDRWGSLTRGKAAKKYQQFKGLISSKLSKDGKSEDKNNFTPFRSSFHGSKPHPLGSPEVKRSQGTNTHGGVTLVNGLPPQQHEMLHMGQEVPGAENSRLDKLNTSFRQAVHNISPKGIIESSLNHSQGVKDVRSHYFINTVSAACNQTGIPSQMAENSAVCSPKMGRQGMQPSENQNRGLASRRSGSYHHLSQNQQQQNAKPWRPHHFSAENVNGGDILPSDHTYSGPVSGTTNKAQTAEGIPGSGGSDSGRGTAGSGNGEVRGHDTSIDSGNSRQNGQGHSSGNDSEWVDLTDTELQRIVKLAKEKYAQNGLVRRESLIATPPLPPLSPEETPQASPNVSPSRPRKYPLTYSSSISRKPDLLEAANKNSNSAGDDVHHDTSSHDISHRTQSKKESSLILDRSHNANENGKLSSKSPNRSSGYFPSENPWSSRKDERENRQDIALRFKDSMPSPRHAQREPEPGDVTSTTDALDLDSMLEGATDATSDEDGASVCEPDVHLIRKQLEGLEGMYSEVLKLLGGGGGGGKKGGKYGGDLKSSRRRLHGSLSSLPSSIISSRPGREKRRVLDDRLRRVNKDYGKSVNKRFQRLESHVVTLARSVAHLSSEMRTQHLMFQEIESIRNELAALRTSSGNNHYSHKHSGFPGNPKLMESLRNGGPAFSNPGRVKKLTQFFGDEPPLVRLFLRKLGYEKYAPLFEQEKIGMLELPYLTEERLQKIGIPLGPRLRILQEAQGPIRKEGNLSVYVV